MITPGAINIPSHPGKQHWLQAQVWLQAEYEAEGEGFWCNREVLEVSFERRQLAVATIEGQCVAVLAWNRHGAIGTIDILSVRPDLRRSGVGRALVERTLVRLKRAGAAVVSIQISPMSSEGFWKRMGFGPDTGIRPNYQKDHFMMERILVAPRAPGLPGAKEYGLTVWQGKPWEVNPGTPHAAWNLGPRTERIAPPVITPCEPDWLVHVDGPGVSFRGPAKRLCKGRRFIDGGFLVLTGLVLGELKT